MRVSDSPLVAGSPRLADAFCWKCGGQHQVEIDERAGSRAGRCDTFDAIETNGPKYRPILFSLESVWLLVMGCLGCACILRPIATDIFFSIEKQSWRDWSRPEVLASIGIMIWLLLTLSVYRWVKEFAPAMLHSRYRRFSLLFPVGMALSGLLLVVIGVDVNIGLASGRFTEMQIRGTDGVIVALLLSFVTLVGILVALADLLLAWFWMFLGNQSTSTRAQRINSIVPDLCVLDAPISAVCLLSLVPIAMLTGGELLGLIVAVTFGPQIAIDAPHLISKRNLTSANGRFFRSLVIAWSTWILQLLLLLWAGLIGLCLAGVLLLFVPTFQSGQLSYYQAAVLSDRRGLRPSHDDYHAAPIIQRSDLSLARTKST